MSNGTPTHSADTVIGPFGLHPLTIESKEYDYDYG